MLKYLLALTFFSLSQAYAIDSGTGGCVGNYKGMKITLLASMSNVKDLETGRASVTINNRVLTHFDGRDMNLSILTRSFKVRNAHGDYASGKLTNLFTKSGILTELRIPSFGIHLQNVPMECWTKKN